MKLLVRWGAMLGLMGGVFFAPPLMGKMQVLALPEEQILKTLQPVPVFAIANSEGAPLVASPNGQGAAPVSGIFISQKDAQSFLENLKTKNPDLAKNVRVVPISLGEIYQLRQQNKNKPDRLDFAFVPMQQQVNSALELLKKSNQQATQFNGVPLFIARGGTDKGYLTIQRGQDQVIPLFFKREELQGVLDRFKQQQPNLASTIDIQVVNLEGVIQTLQTSTNSQLGQIVLIPPQESLEFVRSLGSGGGGAAPAPKPASSGGSNRPSTPTPKPKK